MGRPKGSTVHSDTKIILALLYKPRRFSEFEWALVKEFRGKMPENVEAKSVEAWKRFVRGHEKFWRIPRKTLARRLKTLVAKGWIIRKILPEHGHHVEYRLDFSMADEMLEELPMPELRLTRSQVKLLKKIDAVVPLKEELVGLEKLSDNEVLEIFLRLRRGEFVCPGCLEKGEGKKACNVSKDVDGRLYCRNCGEEVLLEECEELLKEIIRKQFSRKFDKSIRETLRFFDAIDRQLEKENNKVDQEIN